MSTTTTWKRIAAGYYTNGTDHIAHIVTDDDGSGYGASDYWVIEYADGSYSDPIATLRDAKAMA